MRLLPKASRLFELYREAESVKSLADSLGVTRAAIYDALKGYQPYIDYQRVRAQRWKLVVEYEKQGLKRYEIAEKMNLSIRMIQYLAKEARGKGGYDEKEK